MATRRRSWRIVIAGCAGVAGVCPAAAQVGVPSFERISPDQGLSQGYVTALAQGRQGFLWVGTQDGLNRYDGYAFTVYRYSPPPTPRR